MQNILRRRTFRDLKNSFSRYFALFCLIILGMYIIVELVGGADNVITSVENGQIRNKLEDGSFTTFLPLEKEAVDELAAKGITLEEMFYLEYILENESTLRVYADRREINLLDISSGQKPAGSGEIVLEKQYAISHQLEVGDTIFLGTTPFSITGIATTPDYDSVLMEFSSAVADGNIFGTAFVSSDQYKQLKEKNDASKSEEYNYSYLLNDQMTHEELKDYLLDLEFDESGVTDIYFREMIDSYTDRKEELQDGIRELTDGSKKLNEGLEELADHNEELLDGYTRIFEAYLDDAFEQLEAYEPYAPLTVDNYQEVLEELMERDQLLRTSLEPILDGLNRLRDYQQAIISYTDGVTSLQKGTSSLNDGMDELQSGLLELSSYHTSLNNGAAGLFSSYLSETGKALRSYDISVSLTEENYEEVLSTIAGTLRNAGNTDTAAELEQTLDTLHSIKLFKDAVVSYTAGVESAGEGAAALVDGTSTLYNGFSEVSGYNQDLIKGFTSVFDANLSQINEQLTSYGIDETLTRENYQQVLEKLMGAQGDAIIKETLMDALEGLNSLQEYLDALTTFTEGVQEATDGSVELMEGLEELENEVNDIIDDLFEYEIDNLVQFLKVEDNPRVSASIEDEKINKYTGMLAGVIVMVLFTYVISVFVVHALEKEQAIIGAFYALGVKKRTLIRHYLTLPTLITAAGGIIGTVLGFSPIGTGYFAQDSINYFSLPQVVPGYPLYLILYGMVMPPVIACIVNYFVINKRLKQPVLHLMRKEPKEKKVRQVNLKRLGYIRTFQIRQFLREYRSGLTILFGMFISLLILMLGLNCYVICINMQEQNKADISYEYIYSFKYPPEDVPSGGMGAYLKSLNKEAYGYNLDVTLLGIESPNEYFDFEITASKNSVVISSSAATKFKLKKGDQLILADEVEEQNYAFTVADIVPYSIGLYVFMDIDSMRDLFGTSDTYYNVVFADKDLDIESGRLYTTTSRKDVEKASDVFINQMMPLVYMMTGISILIFMIVMYLMMKVMIDQSAGNISMMKVFGYQKREIKKLYLDGNFIWIVTSSLLCIPLSKMVMNQLYPTLVANVSIGMDLTFPWQMYIGVFAGIIACYFIINQMLIRRVNHFLPADILKDRE